MPLYEFKCPACGTVKEVLMPMSSTSNVFCNHDTVHFRMVKQVSAPAFHVKGFNALNGYANERTFEQQHTTGKLAGIKTKVTGNPEGFADGLHR